MLTIIIFIIVLGLLVFVHELGHFLVAKRAGMQVDEFGFGFPPRVAGVYKTVHGRRKVVWGPKLPQDPAGTVYSVNLIPLGGFVKIVGENGDAPDNPRSFGKKSFGRKLSTLLAGVVMNVLLAWVLITTGFLVGVPTVLDEQATVESGTHMSTPSITILDTQADSPASRAGLAVGDVVVSIDGQVFSTILELQQYVRLHKGQTFTFEVARGRENKTFSVESNANPGPSQGPTGIALGFVGTLRYSPLRAIELGFISTGEQLREIVVGLGKLFAGKVSLNQIGGPVKIAQMTGQASQLGFAYLVQFTAFLSLNLAVLNALPIPALDGGRVLFLVIEKLRRRPNNPMIEQTVNAVGFLALLALMLVVTINDFHGFSAIGRLFSK